MPPEKLSNIIYALIIIMHTCTKMNTQYWHNLQNFMKWWQKLQILYMSHVEFESSLKTISTSTPLQTCKFIVVLSTEMCWALTYIILQTCLNSSPVFDLLFFLLSVNSDINYDRYSPKCGQLRWKWWFLTHSLLPTITILAHNWQNGCHVFLPM